MQVVARKAEGLSRHFGVTVPAVELSAKLDARIAEIAPTLRLKGFRPGKASPAHVKRLYGKQLMGEVVEQAINETSQQLLAEEKLRVASQPELKPSSDMEAVLAGRQDLAYDLDLEVMPDFEPADVAGLELTRLIYEAPDSEVDERLAELARQNRTYAAREGEDATARDGDQLLIDFTGTVEGKPFEGGEAKDVEIVLGAGQFLPGFEAALTGAAAGASVTVTTAFPTDYPAGQLAGKAAEFAVEVREVRAPVAAAVDDSLAQRLGLSDLAGLRDVLKNNLDREYREASRFKLKRALLDELDRRHAIELPARMVEAEFHTIWHEVEHERAAGNLTPEDAAKSEEELRAEYRGIAERRVRLGLVLAEIGRREQVSVSDAEATEALRAQAMQYGERAQEAFDAMRQNPQLQASIRAPIYEEKVVDLILGRARLTDKPVSRDELLAEDEPPAAIAAPPKAKKAARAKKTAQAPDESEAAAKESRSAAAEDAANEADKPRRKRPTKTKAE